MTLEERQEAEGQRDLPGTEEEETDAADEEESTLEDSEAQEPEDSEEPEPEGNEEPEPEDSEAQEPEGNEEPEPEDSEAQEPEGNEAPEPEGNEAQEDSPTEPASEQMKIVIQLGAERTTLGIWAPDTDPHLEVLPETGLEEALAAVPDAVQRALESWAENPLRPRYTRQRKKQEGRNDRSTTGENSTQAEMQVERTPQVGMARLF